MLINLSTIEILTGDMLFYLIQFELIDFFLFFVTMFISLIPLL